jgi:hypothetical protein
MERVSILPIGTFPALREDQHRRVQAGGSEPAVLWGIATSTTITSAPWERGETTDQLRTTAAAPQRTSTVNDGHQR